MPRKRPREIALAVFVVLLVATITWRVRSVAPSAAGAGVSASAPVNNQQPGTKRDLAEVNLDALKADRPEPADSDRNPFRFTSKPPPPPPPIPIPAHKTTPLPGDAGPIVAPPPPPIPLKYIGLVIQGDPKVGRIAVLSDSRGVYHGREGDIIEGRYRIEKIGVESIDLAYIDGRGRQTIRQTGQ
jgi:hypothetical protein